MSKDSYWFRHDASAGRGLRMRKMAHIYGHWGKGIYWDVIEILRDQTNYCFDSDTPSLQMLCDLVGCKDEQKFINWFNDCVKIELFAIEGNKFFSAILCENMAFWDKQKLNGSQGGRPAKPKRNPNPNPNPNPNETIIEQIVQKRDKSTKQFTPPSVSEVVGYFQQNGYSEHAAKKAHGYYDVAGWKDSKGNQVKNWKQKMHGVWFKEENKMIGLPPPERKEVTHKDFYGEV